MTKKILILGVNGFIGSSLLEDILSQTSWSVFGLDLQTDKIDAHLSNPRVQIKTGDMRQEKSWIKEKIRESDVVLPLVAIASPQLYVKKPLTVFELDFEANLEIIRQCVRFKKRVVFPSTSEVYGMCEDDFFDEETSNLVVGPIHKQRWIYSTSKQLLDRLIFAYGINDQLPYTLFRPFNWIGPKIDSFQMAENRTARSITQFLYDIIHRQEINLVDGGSQQRCFTDIRDGTQALLKIIENKNNCADQKIFNIGHDQNEWSVKEIAQKLINLVSTYPQFASVARATVIKTISADVYYGPHYQDVQRRVPSIKRAKQELEWTPVHKLPETLKTFVDYHLIPLSHS